MEFKSVDNSVLDVSTESRKVKVVLSTMGNLDLDNDVMDGGAYTKTIQERGPKGSNLIWHLTDHYPTMKNAIGKFSELYVEGNQLIGITDIPETTLGNDMLELYMKGHINQHSVGFRTIKQEPVNAGKSDEYRLIKEVLLYEGSAVLWGANPLTPTLEAGKSLTKEEALNEYSKFQREFQLLTKSIRNGSMSDESFELMEIRLEQIKTYLDNFTQPVIETVEPKKDEPDYKNLLTEILNKF